MTEHTDTWLRYTSVDAPGMSRAIPGHLTDEEALRHVREQAEVAMRSAQRWLKALDEGRVEVHWWRADR
jgi:hypothetical protein